MLRLPWRGTTLTGRFVARPNRFLVKCDVPGRGQVTAFLPNPGRLWELLFPGVRLHLMEEREVSHRTTKYTVIAVDRDGDPVFLHTHLTNAVARYLIEEGRIEALSGAELVRAEVKVGRSRFDFLLREGGEDLFLEVKSCTLFGNRVAMFPDAVTARGRRHLLELAHLAAPGRTRTAVLFLIHTSKVDWFMPDFHTDLAFSRTLLEVRRELRILPVSVGWTGGLALDGTVREIPVPWDYVAREARDGGSYVLILRLPKRRRIEVGGLGAHTFGAGYHVYVGSAMKGLDARTARHLRLRKKKHWHIDYLRQRAAACVALPIRSSTREECAVARALSAACEPGPAGFGSSDCPCETHLFSSAEDPLRRPDFHAVLQRFRMKTPEDEQ